MAQSRPPDTLVAWLAAVVAARRSHVAALDERDEWTYDRLWVRSRDVANWLLRRREFGPGSRVALMGANEPEYLAAYFGVLRAGGVVVPLNTLLSVSDLHEQIGLVDCVGALVGDVAAESADGISGACPVWPLGGVAAGAAAALPMLGPRSPACVLLTSGSTGRPKGVLHTHGTMLHAALQMAAALPFARDERTVAFLPFFASIPEHVLPTLLVGGTLHTIRRFDPERISTACRNATSFDAVPTLMARLLDHGDLEALRNLRWVMFASEPMPKTLLERWWDVLQTTETHQFYGMTEMLTITNAPHRVLRDRPSVVGAPFPTSTVTVEDALGNEVSPGVEGEVTCRSPARMAKYIDDQEATSNSLTDSGAMRTGDLGVIDEAGYLQLTGRLKDLIISGGLNISPAEIEAVACRHPLVGAAAVVGVPDAHWGETPVVVAVPVNGSSIDAADVLGFCRAELSGFKRPSAAAVMDVLPLTGIGKSSKAEIRRRILGGEVELVRAR